MNAERIKSIRKHGKTARGQKELLKHLAGQKITFKQAIYARCYDCMGYYSDGKVDCKMPHCALYPFNPYKKNREKQTTKKPTSKDSVQISAVML